MTNAMRRRNASAMRSGRGYWCFISKTVQVFCVCHLLLRACMPGGTVTRTPGHQKVARDCRFLEGETKANSTNQCRNSTQNGNILFTQLQQWKCQSSS